MKTITKETPRQTVARLEKRADEMQAEYWAAHYAHRFGESSELGDELEALLERIERMKAKENLERVKTEVLWDYWHHESSGNRDKALSLANRADDLDKTIAAL